MGSVYRRFSTAVSRERNERLPPPCHRGAFGQYLQGRPCGRTATMQLGMIGLGRMGGNMVLRLLRAGHDCVAYDRDQ